MFKKKKKRTNSLAQKKKKTEVFFTLLVLGKLSEKIEQFKFSSSVVFAYI